MNTAGFSKEAKGIIGRYEKADWTFTLSKNGHAIGRSPVSDRTCSIPKNLSNARALKNAEGDCDRSLRRDAAERAANAISDDTFAAVVAGDGEPQSAADAILVGGIRRKVAEDRAQQTAEFLESVDRAAWETRPHSVTSHVTGPVVGGKFRPVHYLCVKCEQEFDSARSVGQHSRTCSAQGNVPQTDRLPDGAPKLAPPDDGLDGFEVTEAMVAAAALVEAFEMPPAPVVDPVLDQIRALVSPELVAERDALIAERDTLRDTLARVEADLDALRSLAAAITTA